ncbi:MAG TPA: serine/threonine-protein kinase [Pirellulaceae bacterium]|jgi:hypothetical protein|nr:serine/threonine-protein kinase [Pirellulaceae bacterium]
MIEETEDRDRERCPQCGRELSNAARTSGGLAICPQCAHSVAPPDHGDRSTELYLPDEVIHTTGEERFRLAGRLGEGGFGTVFRAFDRSLRRNVAIKVPKKSAGNFDSRQFILEARAASALRHPNVVTVFDVGFNEGAPYIVSECIEGVSLRQWLDGPHATYDEIAKVFEKLSRAIGYAHAMGVVHRDLKPSNVIVDDANEPHVLDFGLSNSRVTGEAVTFRRDVPVGTPAYMAPEQATGELEKIGPPTDIYALGVVLYQMLTRRLPFVGSAERILDLVVNEEPVRPRILEPRIPRGLEAIALKAMRKSIEDRYRSADALADDIGRYLRGEPVKAVGRHDKRSIVMTARRRFMTGIAATASCGFLGSALWLGYRSYRDDPRVRVRLDGNSGAERVTWLPLDAETGGPLHEESEVAAGDETVLLVPGLYRVIVERGEDYVEALRTVPGLGRAADGTINAGSVRLRGTEYSLNWLNGHGRDVTILPAIAIIPADNLAVATQRYPFGSVSYRHPIDPALSETKKVGTFLLQIQPATAGDIATVFGAPIYNENAKPSDEALLPFPFAVEYAERIGMSLMTAWEWLYAATNLGTTIFPWGDDVPARATWSELAGIDISQQFPKVTGLFSGRGEWTETVAALPPSLKGRTPPGLKLDKRRRLVAGCTSFAFGAPPAAITENDVMPLHSMDETLDALPMGIRCVRRLERST